jgi:hypothetical protein
MVMMAMMMMMMMISSAAFSIFLHNDPCHHNALQKCTSEAWE